MGSLPVSEIRKCSQSIEACHKKEPTEGTGNGQKWESLGKQIDDSIGSLHNTTNHNESMLI